MCTARWPPGRSGLVQVLERAERVPLAVAVAAAAEVPVHFHTVFASHESDPGGSHLLPEAEAAVG
jgi:hypothetical protein